MVSYIVNFITSDEEKEHTLLYNLQNVVLKIYIKQNL